jgi:hypothetical protein
MIYAESAKLLKPIHDKSPQLPTNAMSRVADRYVVDSHLRNQNAVVA